MSSRNARLNALEQEKSGLIYKTLKLVKQKFKTESVQSIYSWVETQFSAHPLFELEYFQISEVETLTAIEQNESRKTYRAFIAVLVRDIRLIDNIDLN
jgi:pantoate--beta-alanine ligase